MLWKPDMTAEISLLPSSSGGRQTAISGEWFGCPCHIDGAHFDARFDLSDIDSIEPGSSVRLRAKFLSPELARPHFTLGRGFSLWEGRIIGTGRVIEIHGDT
jgi:hypothetical protein